MVQTIKKLKINEIDYREDLYPRFEPNQRTIQKYANSIDFLPPIKINQQYILIDGFHRWKAHTLENIETINVEIIETKSEKELKKLAYQLNANHGLQLTIDEKKKYAQEMIGETTVSELANILSVDESTIRRWTENQRKALDDERNRKILELYLKAINTQQSIANSLSIDQKLVSRIIDKFSQNRQMHDMTKEFKPILYNIWNSHKQDNAVDYFGAFPQVFMENLLWYHTNPLDIIYDPFAGGGTTIDACKKMFRRYYCSDRKVTPGRENDIYKHDIAQGLPKELPKPDFAFIDPPYWKQAEGKYSKDKSDLGNMTLEDFNKSMSELLKQLKNRKVNKIAIVIQPTQYKNNMIFTDHIFDFHEFISSNYKIEMRYILPYSTEQYTPQSVEKAKSENVCLGLNRDLVIWKLK